MKMRNLFLLYYIAKLKIKDEKLKLKKRRNFFSIKEKFS